MPLDKNVVQQLHIALLERNAHNMQLALLRLSNEREGIEEAMRFLREEAPADIRAWWLEEDCDLPHDPAAELRETIALTSDFLAGNDGQ